MAKPMVDRKTILDRAKKISAEIGQIFTDADAWNRLHPSKVPIDPDPDGQLAAIKRSLDGMIERG